MIRLLILLLFAFPAIAKDTVVWKKLADVKSVTNNYTPVVPIDSTHIRVYSNSNGVVDGDFWMRSCSWTVCGAASIVLHVPEQRDQYVRTTGVARGESGTYYAVMYTGDGYPTQGGYSPSWATSADGVVWSWQGPITIFGRNQSSAAALVVDESRTDDFACMAWLDLAGGLRLMHAALPCDPWMWSSDGLNVWPIANESPQFVTATKTPYGYHLVGADRWDGTTHRQLRHVFSCDGQVWHVIETASDVGAGTAKGANLAYDPSTNVIHALVSGKHFTLSAKNFGC